MQDFFATFLIFPAFFIFGAKQMQGVPFDVVLQHIVLPHLNGRDCEALEKSQVLRFSSNTQNERLWRELLWRDFKLSRKTNCKDLYLTYQEERFRSMPNLSLLQLDLSSVNFDAPHGPGFSEDQLRQLSKDDVLYAHKCGKLLVVPKSEGEKYYSGLG